MINENIIGPSSTYLTSFLAKSRNVISLIRFATGIMCEKIQHHSDYLALLHILREREREQGFFTVMFAM